MIKVKIVRSIKTRNISIRIMPDTTIIVTAPYFMPRGKIDSIVREKQEWIKKKQHEQRIRNESKATNQQELFYLGRKYPLIVRQNKNSIVEFADKFYVTSKNQEATRRYLLSWYKQQARKVIQQRVDYYTNIYNIHYNTMSITDAETRWGSCSTDKNLHFNWKLVMAPQEVIDYVVSHELAHLTEMNHSHAFWESVRKMFPLYRQYRTWLKRNGDTLSI